MTLNHRALGPAEGGAELTPECRGIDGAIAVSPDDVRHGRLLSIAILAKGDRLAASDVRGQVVQKFRSSTHVILCLHILFYSATLALMKTLKVPDDIHRALRVLAAAIGQPVQEVVERILRKAVSGEKPLDRLDEVLNVLRAPKPTK
jgi:hypothetical protein